MRLPARGSVSIVLFIGFLAAFVIYLMRNLSEFAVLGQVSPWLLVAVALGHTASIAINAVFLIEILKPFGQRLGFRESTYITLMSAIGNYFTPFRGGAGIRALYLKRRHAFSYSAFLSTLAGTYVIAFSVSAIVGLVALFAVRGHAPTGTVVWIAFFLVIVLVGSAGLAMFGVPERLTRFARNRETIGRFTRVLGDVAEGWSRIASARTLVARLGVITLVNLISVIVITHLEAAALGIETRFWGVVLYSVLTSLALIVAVTPGGLGIRESVAILGATAIGFTTPEILSIAVIDRGTLFLVLGVGWLVSPLIFRRSLAALEADDSIGGAGAPGTVGKDDHRPPGVPP